ncbi:hypothetical protein [Sulfuriroseicoccus oceanibius]|uniref:Cytotoxic translational repressor of toxin-antitoxin stability system n=1 Tax=Sulfuriroseicoccus oceanibius TaxID=2707525 RepID=A0A6B3LAE8_9BACT|nr:hypothetical protein [Sulfuriroseicoccus oceanibius]QQL44961.1 hypothetical protein G3M56_014010 [Sulfuriroseicoccus oceanibius]
MLQIVFNEISASEISQLDTLEQLELLSEFKVTAEDVEKIAAGEHPKFGRIERDGKMLFRYRASDSRIYFEVCGESVIVHRVLHRNTFTDFLFRTNLGDIDEDEELAKNKHFWKLIAEGVNARRV